MAFPSPAKDYQEKPLDFNEKLLRHPSATFTMQMQGSALEGFGIYDGDLLIVDRSLSAYSGCLMVLSLNGQFLVRKYSKQGQKLSLEAANPSIPTIELHKADEIQVFGLVTWTLHNCLK